MEKINESKFKSNSKIEINNTKYYEILGVDKDATFEQIKKIAKDMQPKSLSRELKGTVKEVLGTCVAVVITVDGKSPKDVQKEVDAGKLKI